MKLILLTLVLINLFAGIVCSEEIPFLRNGVTAHRGNSMEHPENTIAAFKSAIELGADWIELDVYRSRDGQMVVIHDANTGRVGDRKLELSQTLYEELKSVDVAHDFRIRNILTLKKCPPAHIPLLSDVILLVMRQNKTRVSIQPKDNCVKDVIQLIRDLKAEKWVGFNDGSLAKMKEVKQYEKTIPVFWDRPPNSEIDEDLRIAKEFGFESIVINRKGITQEKIDKIHKAQLDVGVWTVNDPEALKVLLNMGVDRIYTDSPRALLQLQQKR